MNNLSALKYILLGLFLATSLVTLYSKFIHEIKNDKTPIVVDEKFDASLLEINSSEKLDSLIFNQFKVYKNDTAKTVLFIDSFLRNRFYHSYSQLSPEHNWIAYLCGTFFWEDFQFPVVPKDIIQFPMAACSQQGIIFQELLAKLNITCSTIKFFPTTKKKPGHYAVSVFYANSWHFYDSNREPYIVDSTMPSIEHIIDYKLYEKMYSKPSNNEFQGFFKTKSYKRVNREPFSKGKMHYFQVITAFLSDWLWLFLFIALIVSVFVSSRSKV